MASRASSPAAAPPFPWVGMSVLALAVFFMVTSEFLPTGLLPDMAHAFRVSESQIGLLVTLFAGTVVLSAPPLTALTHRYPRKAVIVAALTIFVVANVLAAVAPSYAILAIARVIGGVAHGLFWSVVGAYGAHLVPKEQVARAVAMTGVGTTAAFVLGVPLGTALGNFVGWRLSFVVLACAVLAMIVLVLWLVPPVNHIQPLVTGEIALPMRKDPSLPALLTIFLTLILIVIGHYAFYTYIVPFLSGPVGASKAQIAPLLFVFGAAGAVGLVIAVFVTNRIPRIGLLGSAIVIMLSVLAVALFPRTPAVFITALVTWGIAFSISGPILQARMLHTASPRWRDVASAYMTSSYNIGISGGAFIGGLVLDHLGLLALPVIYIAILAVAVVVILLTELFRVRANPGIRAFSR